MPASHVVLWSLCSLRPSDHNASFAVTGKRRRVGVLTAPERGNALKQRVGHRFLRQKAKRGEILKKNWREFCLSKRVKRVVDPRETLLIYKKKNIPEVKVAVPSRAALTTPPKGDREGERPWDPLWPFRRSPPTPLLLTE